MLVLLRIVLPCALASCIAGLAWPILTALVPPGGTTSLVEPRSHTAAHGRTTNDGSTEAGSPSASAGDDQNAAANHARRHAGQPETSAEPPRDVQKVSAGEPDGIMATRLEHRMGDLEAQVQALEAHRQQWQDQRSAQDSEQVRRTEARRHQRAWLAAGQQQARHAYEASREALGDERFQQVQTLYDRGLDMLQQGQRRDAYAALQQVVEQAPQSPLAPNALLEMASLDRQQGHYREAFSNVKQVVEHYPDARSFDGQLQGARALVIAAELCAERSDAECVTGVGTSLVNEYPGAVLGSGVLASEYVAGLTPTVSPQTEQ